MSGEKDNRSLFELRSEKIILNCIDAIQNSEIDDKKPVQVIITKGDNLRSLKQNRLYWKHMGEVSKHFGERDVDIWHKKLKRKYLHPIYMAGSTAKNIKYQKNYNALLTVKEAGIEIDFESMFEEILTTIHASTKQMKEYIDAYWLAMNQHGVQLTDPDTFYGNPL